LVIEFLRVPQGSSGFLRVPLIAIVVVVAKNAATIL